MAKKRRRCRVSKEAKQAFRSCVINRLQKVNFTTKKSANRTFRTAQKTCGKKLECVTPKKTTGKKRRKRRKDLHWSKRRTLQRAGIYGVGRF